LTISGAFKPFQIRESRPFQIQRIRCQKSLVTRAASSVFSKQSSFGPVRAGACQVFARTTPRRSWCRAGRRWTGARCGYR
jgi:hypothetical protein